MKIYWAGPLFSQAELEFNEKAVKKLEDEGFEVYLPQRDTPQELPSYYVFKYDKEGVDWADIVVGVCDGADMDSGTAWEIGYAYGTGKPIIALRTDFRGLECYENTLSGKFNLMISQSVNFIVESVEEVITKLSKFHI